MIIELIRAQTPEDYGHEEPCGICGERFRVGSVVALALTDERQDNGWSCPSCVGYLGRRNPAKSPTIEEYEEALKCYPKPIWASEEEVLRLEREDPDAAYEGYEASRPRRSPNAAAEAAITTALERSDAFNDALAVVVAAPKDWLRGDSRERTRAVLAEESNNAAAECRRYKEAFWSLEERTSS